MSTVSLAELNLTIKPILDALDPGEICQSLCIMIFALVVGILFIVNGYYDADGSLSTIS